MAIDLLNLEPTNISRDLGGKYLLVYGKPKQHWAPVANDWQ